MTLFGQSCLAARRLVEAGTRFVSVFWDEYGLAGDAWDTHFDHFPRMIDAAAAGLRSGLLGLDPRPRTRAACWTRRWSSCLSEHGRTPKLATTCSGGGRDHWSQAYSALFAGGGIARGRVVGATDRCGRRSQGPARFAQGYAGDDVSLAGHRSADPLARPRRAVRSASSRTRPTAWRKCWRRGRGQGVEGRKRHFA